MTARHVPLALFIAVLLAGCATKSTILLTPQEQYEPETVTVPPHAMVQRTVLSNGSPVDDDGVIVTIRRLGVSSGVWTAYVSTIDGSTPATS